MAVATAPLFVGQKAHPAPVLPDLAYEEQQAASQRPLEAEAATIFVANVDTRLPDVEDILEELFSQVGEVLQVTLPRGKVDGQYRGFAFCDFAEPTAAQSAVAVFNGLLLGSRFLRVELKGQPKGHAPVAPGPACVLPAAVPEGGSRACMDARVPPQTMSSPSTAHSPNGMGGYPMPPPRLPPQPPHPSERQYHGHGEELRRQPAPDGSSPYDPRNPWASHTGPREPASGRHQTPASTGSYPTPPSERPHPLAWDPRTFSGGRQDEAAAPHDGRGRVERRWSDDFAAGRRVAPRR